jgi:copper homeostasis protein
MTVLVEAVACTVDDALRAERAGARRIELVSAISEGGLTPSLGAFREVKSVCQIPVVVMLRPRGGGFVYSEGEFQTILRDAAIFAEAGADGLVVGMLTERGDLDKPRLADTMCAGRGCPMVFHRAFDLVADSAMALHGLLELGFRRVLTSGGAENASLGAATLRELIAQAGGRIEILAGGGVRAGNVAQLVRDSGVDQVHLGPFVRRRDAWSVAEHLVLLDDEVRSVLNALRSN